MARTPQLVSGHRGVPVATPRFQRRSRGTPMTDVDINTPDVQRPMYPRLRESLRGRTMSKWRHVDEWSDDDPAMRRVRDAHARWLVDARGRADDAAVAAVSTEDGRRATRRCDAKRAHRFAGAPRQGRQPVRDRAVTTPPRGDTMTGSGRESGQRVVTCTLAWHDRGGRHAGPARPRGPDPRDQPGAAPVPSGRPRIAAPSGATDDYATALPALVAAPAGRDARGRVRFGAAA